MALISKSFDSDRCDSKHLIFFFHIRSFNPYKVRLTFINARTGNAYNDAVLAMCVCV